MTGRARAESRAILRYLLRLGATGFGGPIALVGYMQRDLVDRRRLVTPEEFRDGLALAQLAPGPLAAQLATYVGWLRGGLRGATLGALAFVAPSFLMVVLLSIAYVRFGGLPWMAGAFHGVGAAVIAVIGRSAVRLSSMTLGSDRLLWGMAIACGAVTAWLEREPVTMIVGSGLLAMALRSRASVAERGARIALAGFMSPALVPAGAAVAGSSGLLVTLLAFFGAAGLFVFGSGLAIVPFLHGGVVREYGWLTDRQFLDAVAVSMITPGPVVITVAFIGYLVAGLAGAVVASVGVFLPVWLVVVLVAPHFQRLAARTGVQAFVQGATAATTGAIAGAAFVLGKRAIDDLTAIVLCLVVLAVLQLRRRIPEALVIAAAGMVGVITSDW
jgi:chromate transporter